MLVKSDAIVCQNECKCLVRPNAIGWSSGVLFRTEMQSPEGSRLRGFYFRLHPLMSGELGGENTSDALVIHYCERLIVFGRQDAVRVVRKTSSGGREFQFA